MDDKNLAKMLLDQEMMRVSKEEVKDAAKAVYNLYSAFVEAGFSKIEALHLVTTILSNGLRGAK